MNTESKSVYEQLAADVHKQVIGQDHALRLITAALFAEGHVLLEDVPGVGKTTLARTLELDFRRVQATPDLLPQDLLGAMIYRQQTGEFELRKGPIFTQMLLFDEINRATPRTASALLEAMAERQVSIDGNTESLKLPFFVIATQNPLESQGVFPLPEAQLDRFLVKVKLGYPSLEEERSIVRRFRVGTETEELQPVLRAEDVLSIVRTTRTNGTFIIGGSPRASLGITGLAQALAYIDGRTFVVPDDVKLAVIPVLGHRVQVAPEHRARGKTEESALTDILNEVPVPTEIAG